LAYTDRPSEAERAIEDTHQYTGFEYSLGLKLTNEGVVVDVIPGKPAAKAGIGPGMRIRAVNQRRFSTDVIHEEVRNAKSTGALDLLVGNGRSVVSYKLNFREGEKHPVLERNDQPPLLDDILRPLTK
jgi:predicted metalloprotease with PDZ domain